MMLFKITKKSKVVLKFSEGEVVELSKELYNELVKQGVEMAPMKREFNPVKETK